MNLGNITAELLIKNENKDLQESKPTIYSCMNCGADFEELSNDACPYCGSGDYTSYEELEEDNTSEKGDTALLNIDKNEFLGKLNSLVTDNYILNDELYNEYGDIELTDKEIQKTIYLYRDADTNKISVSVGATKNRKYVDTMEEAVNFINTNLLAAKILQFYNEYNPYDEYGDGYCTSISEIIDILNDDKRREELKYNLQEAQKDLDEDNYEVLKNEVTEILKILNDIKLEALMIEDRHMVDIPIDSEEKEDSFAYYNKDGGISFNVPDDVESFVKNKDLLNFYYKCADSKKYSEEQLQAIKDVLMFKEWKWLNNVTMKDIERICNYEYSPEYIKSFGQIMHYNRRITSDIFFNNTDPNSEYEFIQADSYVGLNCAICCLIVASASNEETEKVKNIYHKVKELGASETNIKILSTLQSRICRPKDKSISEIIDKCLTELNINV